MASPGFNSLPAANSPHVVYWTAGDLIADIVRGLVLGMRDSLCGVTSIYRLRTSTTARTVPPAFAGNNGYNVDDRSNCDRNAIAGETLSRKVFEEIQSFTILALRRERKQSSDTGDAAFTNNQLSFRDDLKAAGAGSSTRLNDRPKIIQRLIQCCLLNGGVFLLSLLLFQYVLLPSLRVMLSLVLLERRAVHAWRWLQPLLSYLFKFLWVLPLYLLSRIVNYFWFQDIADQAYRHYRGRPQAPASLARVLADNLFSSVVQLAFVVQSQLVQWLVPVEPLARLAGFVHFALLNSLYTFEYKWYNMGWELHQRLRYLEHNWPYFVGFGLPLAVVASLPESWFVSACLYAILFPLLIVAGHQAGCPPREPAHCPRRPCLQLFNPAVCVSNAVFNNFVQRQPAVARFSVGQPLRRAAASSVIASPVVGTRRR